MHTDHFVLDCIEISIKYTAKRLFDELESLSSREIVWLLTQSRTRTTGARGITNLEIDIDLSFKYLLSTFTIPFTPFIAFFNDTSVQF